MLLRQGVSVFDTAKRLGHANPAITLRTYSHSIRGADRATADTFERDLQATRERLQEAREKAS